MGRELGWQSIGGVKNRDRAVSAREVTRIPFKIDDEIMVSSQSIAAHRTKSKIVGAVHGNFILIKEPIVVINERLMAILDMMSSMFLFYQGISIQFSQSISKSCVSRCRLHRISPKGGVYQVREHRRIKVNIETKYALSALPTGFPETWLT